MIYYNSSLCANVALIIPVIDILQG
uniref:Uncharacterized protein n=1 Tax=Anguilla anguilla TaxID=7936 RepID=A0A0E9RRD8_ANGAN